MNWFELSGRWRVEKGGGVPRDESPYAAMYAAEGATFERRRFMNHQTSATTRRIPTKPPIIPPAIAPTFTRAESEPLVFCGDDSADGKTAADGVRVVWVEDEDGDGDPIVGLAVPGLVPVNSAVRSGNVLKLSTIK